MRISISRAMTIGGGFASEPQNLLLSESDFANAAWAGGYSGNVAVSANSFLAPDGTMTADTLTASASSARVAQNIVLTGGQTYRFKVWLRRKTGSGAIVIGTNIENGTFAGVTGSISAGGWTRVSYSGVPRTTTGIAYPFIQLDTSGDEVYAWRATLY
jgi:hypothetical protein